MNRNPISPSMRNSTRLTAPLVRWSLAIILICGFGLLGAAPLVTEPLGSVEQSLFDANTDLDLLAHSESLTAAKRSNTTARDQTGEDEINQHWLALINPAYNQPPIPDTRQRLRTAETLPSAKIPSLQQLNAPRAPPLA